MARRVRRLGAVLVVLALVAVGCGNSDDEDAASDDDRSETTTDRKGDRDEFVALEDVPGVTDDEIRYAIVGTRANNPLGTCILDCYRDGIDAYFAYRNAEGGIYGRKLVVAEELDDELTKNQVRALEVTSSDKVFGVFNATLLATGWGDLDKAGVPTYTWGIHATEVAGRMNLFPSIAASCFSCSQRAVPYAAKHVGATKVASLGYGISENSKVCANAVAGSFRKYEAEVGADVVYLNDDLAFGLPNGIAPEVTAMKRAGVEFISTCLDLNGMKTLAQELARQRMEDVVLYHPNTYNQSFVAGAGALFEGDLVSVQFRPFEAEADGTGLEHFLEWMKKTGTTTSELAMVGWINADLAYKGLLAAGPEFDRASVVAATNRMTAYSADGLIVPIDWTRQHNPPTEEDQTNDYEQECTVLVEVRGGEFKTLGSPDKPWLCWSNESLDWSEPTPTSFE